MNITINLQGDKELMAKLKRLADPSEALRRGMRNFVEIVDDKALKPRPPESQANKSPGVNGYSWYVRNYGVKTITGKSYKTSQQMSKQWHTSVVHMGGGVRATIRNDATYSPFVKGDKQVWYHKQRGWINVPEWITNNAKIATAEISKEVNKELNK